MKIMVYCRSQYSKLLYSVGNKLKEYPQVENLICFGHGPKPFLNGGTWLDLDDYLRNNWNKIDISTERLGYIQSELNESCLSELIYSDPFHHYYQYTLGLKRHWNKNIPLKILSGTYNFYCEVFAGGVPDLLVSEAVTAIPGYLGYLMVKKHGKRFAGIYQVRHGDGIYISGDETDTPEALIEIYQSNLSNSLQSNNFSETVKCINAITAKKMKPIYMEDKFIKYHYINKNKTTTAVKDLISYIFQKITKDPIRGVFRLTFFDKILLNYKILINSFSKKRTGLLDLPQCPFFLFPLHFIPEATTLVQSPEWGDMNYTILQIAKTLPLGTKLFVKKHPSDRGQHAMQIERLVKNLPNVELINENIDMEIVYSKTLGIVTVTSTMGWEAAMRGIPVVVLGRVFYDSMPNVVKISSFDHLKQTLIGLAKERRRFTLGQDTIAFVAAYFDLVYPGNFMPGDAEFDTDKNYNTIAESLLKHYEMIISLCN